MMRPPVKRPATVEIDGVKMSRIAVIAKYKHAIKAHTLLSRLKFEPVCTSERLLRKIRSEKTKIIVTVDGEQMPIKEAIRRFSGANSAIAVRSRLMRNRVCTSEFLTQKAQRRVVDASNYVRLNGCLVALPAACKTLSKMCEKKRLRLYKYKEVIETHPDLEAMPDDYEAVIFQASAETIMELLT